MEYIIMAGLLQGLIMGLRFADVTPKSIIGK